MIKGILFDKDGTLLDFNKTWLEPYLQASEYLAECAGKPELKSVLMEQGGYIEESNSWLCDSLLASGSNEQIFDFWEHQLGSPLSDEQVAHVKDIFSHASSKYVPVLEDTAGFLSDLKNSGLFLGLATMDDESNARNMLSRLKLSRLFDFVCGADSGFGVKPESGMVDGFCEACGILACEMLMVGDSPKDLNMGKKAGAAQIVGVLTGAHSRQELEHHADVIFDDISGIVSLLN